MSGTCNGRIRFDRMRAHMHRVLRMTAVPELYYRFSLFLRWTLRSSRVRKPHVLPSELIVSLTSFPARFPTLHLTIQALLTQSVAPDRVILWLYAPDARQLPEKVRCLTAEGLEIRELDEDLKSYKKIIPALEVFPAAFVATADDDLYYPGEWLHDLVSAYASDCRHVIGCRAHRVRHGDCGALAPYSEWEWELRGPAQGATVFLTGGAGALYPPGAFPAMAPEHRACMQLCATADDVWINFMFRLNGFIAQKTNTTLTVYDWMGTRASALGQANVIESGNDDALAAMIERHGDVFREQH